MQIKALTHRLITSLKRALTINLSLLVQIMVSLVPKLLLRKKTITSVPAKRLSLSRLGVAPSPKLTKSTKEYWLTKTLKINSDLTNIRTAKINYQGIMISQKHHRTFLQERSLKARSRIVIDSPVQRSQRTRLQYTLCPRSKAKVSLQNGQSLAQQTMTQAASEQAQVQVVPRARTQHR